MVSHPTQVLSARLSATVLISVLTPFVLKPSMGDVKGRSNFYNAATSRSDSLRVIHDQVPLIIVLSSGVTILSDGCGGLLIGSKMADAMQYGCINVFTLYEKNLFQRIASRASDKRSQGQVLDIEN
jgi:hypothetical protein